MAMKIAFSNLLIPILLTAPGSVWAMYVEPDDTFPFDRLIENLQQQLEAGENLAYLHGQLARTYSLEFAYGWGDYTVLKNHKGGPDAYSLYDTSEGSPRIFHIPEDKLTRERMELLLKSIEHYRKAAELEPENAFYLLGLAFTQRTASDYAEKIYEFWQKDYDNKTPEEIKEKFLDNALSAYRLAFQLSSGDRKWGSDSITSESAYAIVEILEAKGEPTDDEKREIKYVKRTAIDISLQTPMVTPIIFSLEQAKSLDQLLDENLMVSFNLDGLGARKWPWVRPDTAFLVWDGDNDRQIKSGKQLIGSVTWWMFWDNGYQVLQALDDDHDGWLTGSELTGLAVWQDHNSNGISESGEVQTVFEAGIQALAAGVTGTTSGMPCNEHGVRFSDGSILPTFDWIVSPAD